MTVLRGDGIVLRPPVQADTHAIVAAVHASLEDLMPWMPWATPTYDTEAATSWMNSEPHGFVIIDHDGELVGACGLNAFDHLNRRANLGYWVRTGRHGRGIATAATVLVRDHGIRTLGLQRIEIAMSVHNHASRRVAQRAGATYEGVLRARLHLHGQPHDAHSYAFTKETSTTTDIAPFDGDRSTLRNLFTLADDSPLQIDRTMHLGAILTARDRGRSIGMVHLIPTDRDDSVEIRTVAVDESHQRQGIGRALLDAAIDFARAAGHTHLVVATATADIGNLRFYQRCGFRLTHIEPDAFTVDDGYPTDTTIDGIALRDRAWLRLTLR